MKRSSGSGLGLLVFSLVLFGAALAALFQRQAIYDWTQLRSYTPPPAIAQLASDATMNDKARRIFYVYHPELNPAAEFNQNCSGFGEHTIVLGCYSTKGIFLFDVTDKRLHGVEQVTAAHEMLHAAYDRLSPKERARIDKLTEEAFANTTDKRIKDMVKSYRDRDPSVVPDELHSIIGTEVRDIPQELETYYQRYFTNRLKIVDYSEKYENTFTALRTKATTLEAQITGLQNDLELKNKSLEEQQNEIIQERATLDRRSETAVNAFNQKVINYNQEIRDFNDLLEDLKALIKEYQAINIEKRELNNAINSRSTL